MSTQEALDHLPRWGGPSLTQLRADLSKGVYDEPTPKDDGDPFPLLALLERLDACVCYECTCNPDHTCRCKKHASCPCRDLAQKLRDYVLE